MIATYTKGSLVFHYESIVLLFHWTSTVLLHLLQNTEQSERKKNEETRGAFSLGLGRRLGECFFSPNRLVGDGQEGRTGSVLGKWFIYVFIYIYSAPTI